MDDALFHIANNPGKYRPTMNNNFRVIIPGLEGQRDITSEEDDAVLGEDTELVLKISNDEFQEPSLKQGSVGLKRGNLTMEFPGAIEAFSSTSKFTCLMDADTYGKLYAWKCQAGNHEDGTVGDPQDYWKTVTVEVLTGKGELIGTWTLNNCWLSSLEGVNFANGDPQLKTCTGTLKYFKPIWRKA